MVSTPSAASESVSYEQEAKLEKLFNELQAGFKKLETISDPNKQANVLKELTNKMQEAKRYIYQYSAAMKVTGTLFVFCPVT